MKKTGFYGYVYDFSVDHDAIAADNIYTIHKYLMKKNNVKCLDLLKKMFAVVAGFIRLNINPLNSIPLKCVSMNNQECKVRPEVININSNEPLFYPYSILVYKCSDSCSNINDPYAKLCVPDVVKNMNIKVFNLMSRICGTRYASLHKT